VGRDHLAAFTAFKDKTEEVIPLAAGDHLLANIYDRQRRSSGLNGGVLIVFIGLG